MMHLLRLTLFVCALLPWAVQAGPAAEPPPVAARAWLLLDWQTGTVLAERNADQPLEPASLTKLMTARLVFEALDSGKLQLQDKPAYSLRARNAPGARLPLDPQQPATVEQLLQGMIVLSANDAAITLAEAAAGTEAAFVERMNEEARRLKLTNTRFFNPTGQPAAGHVSTARDMATLAASIIRDYSRHYALYRQKIMLWKGQERRSNNVLLWRDPTVDGMKTGTTRSAGYCLVASAARGERRLIAVILGASSEEGRALEAQKLLNFGMQAWETPRVFTRGQTVASLPVWEGEQEQVALQIAQPVWLTVPAGSTSRLKARLQARQPLVAPLRAGQVLGHVQITLDGRPLARVPAVAGSAVVRSGWLASNWDRLRLWWRQQ